MAYSNKYRFPYPCKAAKIKTQISAVVVGQILFFMNMSFYPLKCDVKVPGRAVLLCRNITEQGKAISLDGTLWSE